MAHLFISYAHNDDALVYRFTEGLLDRGYELWIDKFSIRAGETWATEIENGIQDAAYFLLIVTENSAASDYVKKEVAFAQRRKKTIIPIILHLDSLKPLGVDSAQGVKFPPGMDTTRQEYRAALEKLVGELKHVVPDSKRWNIEQELLHAPADMKVGDLEAAWRVSETYPGGQLPLVALRIGYTLYGMEAFLVAPREAKLHVPEATQVYMHCTGKQDEYRRRLSGFCTYVVNNQPPLWAILIRGPISDDEYRLPRDPDAWKHVVAFAFHMMEAATPGANSHAFYLNAPVALGMMLGSEARARKLAFEVYHLDDQAANARGTYFQVTP